MARPTTRTGASVGVLDPRRPLVVDTRPLGRRPGSMLTERREVPAPPSLGLDLLRVPEGAPVELDLRLESVLDGVLITAEARAEASGECARCLEPLVYDVEATFTELFAYPEQTDRHARVSGEQAEDDDLVRHLEGDLADLTQPLRDAVVLGLPASPLCDPDCAGLCVECGVRLDDAGPGHAHAAPDPRWAALAALPASVRAPAVPDPVGREHPADAEQE